MNPEVWNMIHDAKARGSLVDALEEAYTELRELRAERDRCAVLADCGDDVALGIQNLKAELEEANDRFEALKDVLRDIRDRAGDEL
jgi:hypothetical protein